VGFREVAAKRRRWRRAIAQGRQSRFSDRHFPVVIGPAGRFYAVDGHHWMRAFLEEGVRSVAVAVIGGLPGLCEADFWSAMTARGWCHPYDAAGAAIAFADMPASIADLSDDPFRSLASSLRRSGAIAKRETPFSEFECARFLRAHIPLAVAQGHYPLALAEALRLARQSRAQATPWPSDPGFEPASGVLSFAGREAHNRV
jgi:hypothetical protein